MKRVLWLTLMVLLSGWMVSPLMAVITIPNIFSPFTTISSAQMNANFAAISVAALNKNGDTITGNIAVSPGVTIDGASISSYLLGSGKFIATSTAADAIKTGGGITAGTGVVAIVGTDGRIPTLTGTTVASFAGIPLLTYTETKTAPAISGGTLALDLSLGTQFAVAFGADVSTLTVTNWCASGKACGFTLALTANGSAHTVTWPAAYKWPGGVAPTITSTNNKVDVFTFISYDGGTTIYSFVSGQSF